MTAAILDPGQAIAAAMRDLYDELRAIVDRGPTDDPGLLDEIGRLTGRIRGRITRARKKAEPAEATVADSKPVAADRPSNGTASAPVSPAEAPTVVLPIVVPGGPRHASPQTAPDAPTVPRHRVVPATVPVDRSAVVTVRLPRDRGGRHRQRPARLPLWIHALVILLIVGGIALGATASAWGFTLVPVGAAALTLAHRCSVHRPASTTTGGGR